MFEVINVCKSIITKRLLPVILKSSEKESQKLPSAQRLVSQPFPKTSQRAPRNFPEASQRLLRCVPEASQRLLGSLWEASGLQTFLKKHNVFYGLLLFLKLQFWNCHLFLNLVYDLVHGYFFFTFLHFQTCFFRYLSKAHANFLNKILSSFLFLQLALLLQLN